jgi:SAM-dependent methyltransferase
VAREVIDGARVAYVDYDPVVVSHANALLTEPDRSVAVRGDLREPAALLADPVIRGHLDFGRPVAVFLLAILHFVSDDDDPAQIIATIRDALAPGSYLVVSHVVPGRIQNREVAKEIADRIYEIYGRATEPLSPRTPEQIAALLDGFELIEPEVLAKHAQPHELGGAASESPVGWRVLARKP